MKVTTSEGSLGPRDLAGIVGDSFAAYRKDVLPFAAIVWAGGFPLVAFIMVFAPYTSASTARGDADLTTLSLLMALMAVALFLSYVITPAAIACAYARQRLGDTVDVGGTYSFVLHRLMSLLGAAFLIGLALFGLGVTIIGVPVALYFGVAWAFTLQAIVLEGCSARKSLSRSSSLVKGDWWRVLGILVVLQLIIGILAILSAGSLGFFVGLIGTAAGASTALMDQVFYLTGLLVGLSFTPIAYIGATILYFDLWARKEGYNFQRMGRELKGAGIL